MTENQIHDIARRDKLRRLRAQEDDQNQTEIFSTITSPFPSSPIVSPTTLSSNQIDQTSQSIHEDTSLAPDLLKDHIDSEHTRRQKKVLLTFFSY